MKRIITIILSIVFVITLASCNSTSNKEPEKGEPITLTTSNVGDYLSIEGVYGKIESSVDRFFSTETMTILNANSDFTFSVSPKMPGECHDVRIEMKVWLTSDWSIATTDPSYSLNDNDGFGYLTTIMEIPLDGSKKETHELVATGIKWNDGRSEPYIWDLHDNDSVYIKIVSVTGTFQPYK